MAEVDEIRARIEHGLLAACKEMAKLLPKEQEKELVRRCEEAFGKREFKEVVVSAPTPEPTAQVSPPSSVVLVRGYP
jgi:hypothetical protein